MVAVSTYTVEVTREDDEWLGEVPGLPGGRTSARTLAVLRREIVDAIILADDLPDDADVEVVLVAADGVPADVAEALALSVERHRVERERSEVTARTEVLARRLVGEGWSVRDVAGALGVTSGRVSQLAGR